MALTASARVRRQACAPLMRLFGECTQKHGMWAVVWSCRAENIAMNECMKEECVVRIWRHRSLSCAAALTERTC